MLPSLFLAVTRMRTVLPTSGFFSVYVCLVAPPMFAQLFPCSSQRRHWYLNVIGCVPVHVPWSRSEPNPPRPSP